jgi:hypothetical protein
MSEIWPKNERHTNVTSLENVKMTDVGWMQLHVHDLKRL